MKEVKHIRLDRFELESLRSGGYVIRSAAGSLPDIFITAETARAVKLAVNTPVVKQKKRNYRKACVICGKKVKGLTLHVKIAHGELKSNLPQFQKPVAA